MNKTCELYKKYVRTVMNQNNVSIDNVSANVGVTFEQAEKDLYQMLDAGFFRGAYIDESIKELILPTQISMSGSIINSSRTKIIKCQSCGASNTIIIGRANECQYCGSSLE